MAMGNKKGKPKRQSSPFWRKVRDERGHKTREYEKVEAKK